MGQLRSPEIGMIFEKSSHSCKIYKIIHRDVGLVLSLVEYAYTCCCVVVKYPLVDCYIAIESGTFIVDLPIYLLKVVISHMGVSENVVHPNDPMVLLIIIPTKWLFHWEYYPNIFRQTHNPI